MKFDGFCVLVLVVGSDFHSVHFRWEATPPPPNRPRGYGPRPFLVLHFR